VVIVVFASVFWSDLAFNRQEISEMPLDPQTDANQDIPPNPKKMAPDSSQTQPAMGESDDVDSLDKDLNDTDLNVDSNDSELEAELNAM
jgi:hypothetical protein